MPADRLTAGYLQRTGFQEPVVAAPPTVGDGRADELRALGMQLPLGGLSVREIAVGVGRSAPVRTIDVASQGDGPRMSMGEWEAYWAVRTAPKKGTELVNWTNASLTGRPTTLRSEWLLPSAWT